MKWELAQAMIDRLRGKRLVNRIKARAYPHIYLPFYNIDVAIGSEEPVVYNAEGRKMRSFFLRDIHWAHAPCHMQSQYFLWDRFNIGLQTHFYTHNAMLHQMGKPVRRYGVLWESEAIVPRDYKIFDRHRGLEKDFDLVFTFSEKLLERLDNARFFQACASSWFGPRLGGGTLSEESYLHKSRDLSILASRKCQTPLHRARLRLAQELKRRALADTFGTFDGGEPVRIADTLERYRFSFAIENDRQPFFFTERLTSCFAAMTIPVYLGATQVGRYFNPDGIVSIELSDLDDVGRIVERCTAAEYQARLPAVVENYHRVQEYLNVNDWLFRRYFSAPSDGGGQVDSVPDAVR
ncbi:MAG: glycosyltransferase family 10 domain-containing protein [Phycisphaerales bacterium]